MSEAIAAVLTPEVLLIILAGASLGTMASAIPGISGSTVMALSLPAVALMPTYPGFALLMAVMGAGGFAGSVTAILINVPGSPVNAPSTLDGFPMAQQGRAGVALGASAAASAIGAFLGVGVLIATFPIQRQLVLSIGPAEILALVILGTSLIVGVAGRSPVRGVIAALMGMALGLIGYNGLLGTERYTLGILELYTGIPLVPMFIGLFGVPELAKLASKNEAVAAEGALRAGAGAWTGVKEVLRRPLLVATSGIAGSLVGMVPAVGSGVAAWFTYSMARSVSKQPDTFGQGNVEGVIAPEATVDAGEGASLVPVFVLGIPGSLSTVFVIAAFQFHGILPGSALFRDNLTLIWVMIFALVITNGLTSTVGLVTSKLLVRVTTIPAVFLAPVIFVLVFIGAFVASGTFGVAVALVFGLVGLVMDRYDYSRAAMAIGFILIPIAERSFQTALQLNRGSFDFFLRPITLTILLLTVLVAVGPLAWKVLKRKLSAGQPTPSIASQPTDHYGVGEITFLAGLLILLLYFGFQTTTSMLENNELVLFVFPLFVLLPLMATCIVRITRVIRLLTRERGWRPRSDLRIWYVVGWVVSLAVGIWAFEPLAAGGIWLSLFLLFFELRRPTLRRLIIAPMASAGFMIGIYLVLGEILGLRL